MLFSLRMRKILWAVEYSAEEKFTPRAQEDPPQPDGCPGTPGWGLQRCGGSCPVCPHEHHPVPSCQLHSHRSQKGPHGLNLRSLLPWLYSIKTNCRASPACLWEEDTPAGGKTKGKPLVLNYCLAVSLKEGQPWSPAAIQGYCSPEAYQQDLQPQAEFQHKATISKQILCTHKAESRRKLKLVETHRCQKTDTLKSGVWHALSAPFLQLLAPVLSSFKHRWMLSGGCNGRGVTELKVFLSRAASPVKRSHLVLHPTMRDPLIDCKKSQVYLAPRWMRTKVGNSGGRSSCLGNNSINRKVRNKKVKPCLCCAAFNLYMYARLQIPSCLGFFSWNISPNTITFFNFSGWHFVICLRICNILCL